MPTSNSTTVSEVITVGFYFLLALGVGETLRRLLRIEKKQDSFQEKCPQCKEELKNGFVSKEYMNKWELGREGPQGLWQAINHHGHDEKTGKVTRT